LFINERPITVTHGTNVISGVKKENIINAAHAQLGKFSKAYSVSVPPFWNGKAAERIVEILANESRVRIQNGTGY
jgi:UDP-N-acetylglucosamine 2-epimerase (non-hydrolysing)